MKSIDSYTFKNRNIVAKACLIGMTVLASNTAFAEVRVTAISEGLGFKSLMAGDIDKATKILPQSSRSFLGYSDINNLCVLQILQNREAAAVNTCEKALRKLNATTIDRNVKTSLTAQITTNLAVAQMRSGKAVAAQDSLAKAMTLFGSNIEERNNAEANQKALRIRLLAAK